MLELRIFYRDPFLNLLTLIIFASDLFNIVELWNWLLSLLGGFELLVLLDDGISLLDLSQLVLDLVLGEWESTNHIENWSDQFRSQMQL